VMLERMLHRYTTESSASKSYSPDRPLPEATCSPGHHEHTAGHLHVDFGWSRKPGDGNKRFSLEPGGATRQLCPKFNFC
jgi:hypothetical protein